MQSEEFIEKQRMLPIWAGLVIGLFALLFGWFLFSELFIPKTHHENQPGSVPLYLFIFLFPGSLLWLYFRAVLTTRINNQGIYVKFPPFGKEIFFTWQNIDSFDHLQGKGKRVMGIVKEQDRINYCVQSEFRLRIRTKDKRMYVIDTKQPEVIKQLIDKYHTSL